MTIFEMVFNLIGLVWNLAHVEVLSGLAATVRPSTSSEDQLADA